MYETILEQYERLFAEIGLTWVLGEPSLADEEVYTDYDRLYQVIEKTVYSSLHKERLRLPKPKKSHVSLFPSKVCHEFWLDYM